MLRNCSKNIVLFLEPFYGKLIFLFDLKDRKSGRSLIHDRAMKGNGFHIGLMSQISSSLGRTWTNS